jgi:hypothetical protein
VAAAATLPGIRQLNLTVVVGNTIARRLYTKERVDVMGTEMAALFVDGCYVDECFMQKSLV